MKNNILLFGGGVMAERIWTQMPNLQNHIIGVFDTCSDELRVKKFFHGLEIKNQDFYSSRYNDNETDILVAFGSIAVFDTVKKFVKKYNIDKKKVYVANPYTSIRFFCINDDFEKGNKIPLDDFRYECVRNIFKDDLSLSIFDKLKYSAEYDTKTNNHYEFVSLDKIYDLYYYEENYWDTYEFIHRDKKTATILDCGAYTGDSVEKICHNIPESIISYYAIEPLEENVQHLKENKDLKNICTELNIIECGVGQKNEIKTFLIPKNNELETARFAENVDDKSEATELKIQKIDDLDITYNEITYIKMDIEGEELNALKGGENVLLQQRPYLAICLYHKKNDFIEIPFYLCNILNDYSFYLRGGCHTILWAIPNEKR